MGVIRAKSILLAVCLTILGFECVAQEYANSSKFEGLVAVDTGSRSARKGIGVIVSKDGQILASSAVVDNAKTVRVGTIDRQGMVAANIVSINHDLGLVLLRVDGESTGAQVMISSVAATTGQRAATVIGPDGDRVTGEIATTLRYQQARFFKHNAIKAGTFYGAPLVNDCNEVLAINIVDPAVGRRQARKLPAPVPTAYAVGRDSVVQFLAENQVSYRVAGAACLSLEERAEIEASRAAQETERANGAEAEIDAKQEAIDRAEAEIAQKQNEISAAQERARLAQEEAKRRAEELEKVYRNRRATAAQKREAEEAAAEARRIAESAAEDAAGLAEEIEVLKTEAGALSARLRAETQRRYFIIGGAAVLILLLGLLFGVLLSKRGKKLRSAEHGLSAAQAKLSESFPNIEFRGQDEAGAPFAFIVTGASLLKTQEGVVIGRQPQSATIVLNHAEVSRSHARIVLNGSVARLLDLGSTNGTVHNGVGLQANHSVELRSGDVVEFGKLRLIVRFIND